MLENLTELLLPALLLLAGAAGIAKKQDVYGGMLTGAQDGLRLMLSLTPTLVLMLTAVTMLRESGFFALLTPVFAPVFRLLGIPPEVAPAIGPSVPLLIAKIFGKHTVCTVHGLNWKVDKWRGFASRYMKLGERIAAKYADDLVVLSETEWNYFLQKYDRASILIPNAIRFYEKRPCSLIRERYGLEQGEYILYVGRISPEKGTMDLVEGYRKAKTGKKLVLVGPLDDSEYCRTVQQQAQNDPNIIMTDYVVGDPLKELYSNCGLFVLPSHTEGLSLSLLEALSIGARCLVSDIPENTVVADIYGASFTPEDTDDLARALERECTQEYPDAMRQQQIQYIHTNFEYDVMLDR